jgi:hypothetical protein
MSLWMIPKESRKRSYGPGVGITEAAELVVTRRRGCRAIRDVDTPFSHSRFADARRAVPMSSQASEHRARALRARLSTLAEVCAELGVPLPLRKQLAPVMGATLRQVDRYMAILIAEGVLAPRTGKYAGRMVA